MRFTDTSRNRSAPRVASLHRMLRRIGIRPCTVLADRDSHAETDRGDAEPGLCGLGKWHLAIRSPQHGFDRGYSLLQRHVAGASGVTRATAALVLIRRRGTDRRATRITQAPRSPRGDADQPFFYLAHPMPHVLLGVGPRLIDGSPTDTRDRLVGGRDPRDARTHRGARRHHHLRQRQRAVALPTTPEHGGLREGRAPPSKAGSGCRPSRPCPPEPPATNSA